MIAPWSEEAARASNDAIQRLLGLWGRERQLEEAHKATWTARAVDRPDAMTRCKKWLEKEPPAVGGLGAGQGSTVCYHVAAICYEGFGLSADECLDAMRDWNSRCTDAQGRPWPWSEQELRHKIEGAVKNCDPAKRGYLLRQDRQDGNGHVQANGNGQTRHEAKPVGKIVPPVFTEADVATLEDLAKAGAEIRWLWEQWIQTGVLTAICAEAGRGKTRFVADLLRRIRHGLPWPDGQPMNLPPDTRSLWVVSDNHHDELVSLGRAFEIGDYLKINATKTEPYEGTCLDQPADVLALEARIQAVQAKIVVVDTVGNSTDKNLSRQEDAKGYYAPLQVIARKNQCAVLCVTHLNAAGKLLGRRGTEKVRVVIRLDQPDPKDQRRRLEVAKTNSKAPAPLGLAMGDFGNEYDTSPPEEGAPAREGTAADSKVREAAEWLGEILKYAPRRVSQIRTEAEMTGKCSARTLYRARDVLKIEEYEDDRSKKWWRLPEKDGEEAPELRIAEEGNDDDAKPEAF